MYGSDDELVKRFEMPLAEARQVAHWRDYLSRTLIITPLVGWVIFTPITYLVSTSNTVKIIGVAAETVVAIGVLAVTLVLWLIPRHRAAKLILQRAGESDPDYLRAQYDTTVD